MDSQIFTVVMAVAGLVAGFVVCWLMMRGRSAPAAPAPQARPESQAELTQARERIRQLEQERQAALKSYEELKQQAARPRPAAEPAPAPAAESAAQLATLKEQLASAQAQEKAARADAAKARADAQAEQAQAKEYFGSLEKKHQLATAEHQALQKQANAARDTLEQENAALKRNLATLSAAPRPEAKAAPAGRPAAAQATQLPVLEEQVIALQDLEKSIKKEFQLLAELQRNLTLTSATVQEFHDSPESQKAASPASA